MTTETLAASDRASLARAAAVNGSINAVINGAIQLFLLQGHGPIALSADSIGTEEHTVLGSAVLLAVTLAMILTAVTHLTVKEAKRPFFPDILWLTVKHGFFAFGVVVAGAVLWQRLIGTVIISVPLAVLVLGLIAGLVAAAVHYMTTLANLEPVR
jgi:hypothetical protein